MPSVLPRVRDRGRPGQNMPAQFLEQYVCGSIDHKTAIIGGNVSIEQRSLGSPHGTWRVQ